MIDENKLVNLVVENNEKLKSWPELPQAPSKNHSATALDYKEYFKQLSEKKTYDAEHARGITLARKTITVDGQKQTVLYRNALKAKKTFTPDENTAIATHELDALLSANMAAACQFAQALPEGAVRTRFLHELWNINNPTAGENSASAADIFERKLGDLHSVLGAFFPELSLKEIGERLEAERDMLFVDKPAPIIATFHASPGTVDEHTYEIEIPRTKLSQDQRTFFQAVLDNNASTLATFAFYDALKPWQKDMIARFARAILEENRLRPSQMHFLPMAPNFWTKCTAIQAARNAVPTLLNSMNMHGALSGRIDSMTEAQAVSFQAMQYTHVRHNLGLMEKDVLVYTNFMQSIPIRIAPDGDASRHIRKSASDTNILYSIPLGGWSRTYRFFRPLIELFYSTPFHDDTDDPLVLDAFRIVGSITGVTDCHPQGNRITIDTFMNLDFTSYTDDTALANDIKLDLEQIYRTAMKMEELRHVVFYTDNLRLATLRSTLAYKMSELEKKLPTLGYSFNKSDTKHLMLSTKAHTFGCKSSIDRAKLVALHATVHQLKEHYRRQLWQKTFPRPASTSLAWLKASHAFFFSMVWLSKVTGPVSSYFAQGFAAMVNKATQWLTGKSLTENREAISLEIMNRRVPIIDQAVANSKISQEQKNALLIEKASIINNHVKADLKIMAATCQSGHTQSMPQYGGSFGCPGVKSGVRKSVAPALESEHEHITSASAVSDLNHSVATKKKGLYWKDAPSRTWVQEKHNAARREAENATEYMPAARVPGIENKHIAINNSDPASNRCTDTDSDIYDEYFYYTNMSESKTDRSSLTTPVSASQTPATTQPCRLSQHSFVACKNFNDYHKKVMGN